MRPVFLFCAILSAIAARSQNPLVLQGLYYGQNLYIQNPATEDGSFCTDSIWINGKKYVPADMNSSAFEIRPAEAGLKKWDTLTLLLYHKNSCQPKLLNNGQRPPQSQVVFTSVKLDSTGLLHWTTINDDSPIRPSFEVMQYRWGAWRNIGYAEQHKKDTACSYTFPVRFHSGQNKFRVNYRTLVSNKPWIESPADSIVSKIAPVSMIADSTGGKIRFSAATDYEIVDKENKYGRVVHLHGNGSEIDLQSLGKGEYLLRYDNTETVLRIRRGKIVK